MDIIKVLSQKQGNIDRHKCSKLLVALYVIGFEQTSIEFYGFLIDIPSIYLSCFIQCPYTLWLMSENISIMSMNILTMSEHTLANVHAHIDLCPWILWLMSINASTNVCWDYGYWRYVLCTLRWPLCTGAQKRYPVYTRNWLILLDSKDI